MLPEDLLQAVCDSNGGKISLVTGAGVSVEAPTRIPVASVCAKRAYDQLVADGVIEADECSDPWNLSALADLIKQKRNSQLPLVSRLPVEAMRNAKPNDGHLLAIALMVEGVISNIVTLNYDRAFSNAISELGIQSGISIIRGPEEHALLSRSNVIYLHRSVDADMETWVLTTNALEEEWKGGWEELMAGFTASSPFVVFAGLGSSCGVLTHTSVKIKKALGEHARALFVNPGDPAHSKFVVEVGLHLDDCIRLGWVAFMRALSARFVTQLGFYMAHACVELSKSENWLNDMGEVLDDTSALIADLNRFDLITLSIIRARWHLNDDIYLRFDSHQFASIAEVLVAVRLVERIGNAKVQLLQTGRVAFKLERKLGIEIMVVTGCGLRWGSLESRINQCETYLRQPKPDYPANRVLAAGMTGMKPEAMAPPASIIDVRGENDIIPGKEQLRYWSVDEIRANHNFVTELLS